MKQLTLTFPETSTPAVPTTADVVYKQSALTKEASLILNYLDFFGYDAADYPNFCDYEDFETFTNTLHIQGELDYERENIANEAAYELLESVKDIPEIYRKEQLKCADDWYQYYRQYCIDNHIKPVTYNTFSYYFDRE